MHTSPLVLVRRRGGAAGSREVVGPGHGELQSATLGQTTPIELVAAKPGKAIVIGYVGRYEVRAPITVSAH
jgi:hypothetical protein